MKVTIDGYVVEIKARYFTKDKASKKDTARILCKLENLAWNSAERNSRDGYTYSAADDRTIARQIHDQLAAVGFYGTTNV